MKVCPQDAISLTKDTGRRIDRTICDQCLLCVQSCLYGSLVRCGTHMTVNEVLDEVLQDRIFYKNSGGGVTVSGGEPLSQSAFVSALFAECKNEGLQTALDTSGYAKWKHIQAVLPFVDLILFDIKHLDPEIHQKIIGVSNDIILDNLEKVSKVKEVWLRIPLVPGFNDSEEQIRKIALLGKEVGVQKISLLPYHEGGRSKSDQLGIAYGFPDRKTQDEASVNHLKRMIETIGLAVSVGN